MEQNKCMASTVWETVLSRLQSKSETVCQYFGSVQALEITDGVLSLGVPDDFFRDFILENYGDLLAAALVDVDGIDYKFEFSSQVFIVLVLMTSFSSSISRV